MSDQDLWVIQIRGGQPFTLQVDGNPVLEHNGRDSVCHMVLSDEEAEQIQQIISDKGATGILRRDAGPTETQREIKEILNEGPERVWPCARCPKCPWLDPRKREPCGLREWLPEVVEDLMKRDRWREAVEACPLPPREEG